MTIRFDRVSIHGGQRTANWNPARYERAVLRLLHRLMATATGSIVLGALRRRTVIIPYPAHLGRNADADVATPYTDAEYRAGYRATDYLYSCGSGDPLPPRRLGTGLGARAEVRFTPGNWIGGVIQANGEVGAGSNADEVLLHELMHAVRVTMGIGDCRPLRGPLQRYDNRSEFYAVLVENVYSSETGREPRRDHHGYASLDNPRTQLDEAVQYYEQPHNHLMIMEFCRSMPRFTRDLARVPCNFNPFREYYREMIGLDPSSVRANSRPA